jgi:hypothetical protein
LHERRKDETIIDGRLHATRALRIVISFAMDPCRLPGNGNGDNNHGGCQRGTILKNTIGMKAPSSRENATEKGLRRPIRSLPHMQTLSNHHGSW